MQHQKIWSGAIATARCGLAIFGLLFSVFGWAHGSTAQGQPKKQPPPKWVVSLVENGRSRFVIALARDAIPAERTAARELQTHLEKITGARLPIRFEGAVPAGAPQILLGPGRRVRAALPGHDWTPKRDGIVLRTVGRNRLILAGDRPRGTLYAVYQFLEDYAGVRWWTPTESHIPRTAMLRVPRLDVVYAPPFSYREHFTTSVQRDPVFATRMRENGYFQTQDAAWGGRHVFVWGFVHSFADFLPPQRYFRDHPEWYSDPANGNRPATAASPMPAPQQYQLCLSNEAARREFTRNVLDRIRGKPEAGFISISQNDNTNACRCEADVALEKQEGSPAGPLLRFVNAVARDIARERPDMLVETLAYQHTRHPPRTVRPERNVIVRLASIEADFARPLESDANADFRANLRGWKAIAPRLFVWDYMTNFANYMWPHPNLRVLGPNLRTFARHNVIGVFEHGDAQSNNVGDFVSLRAWLVSRLMWNPQRDPDALIDEFLRGYYGPAAPHLRAYINLIHDTYERGGYRLTTYGGDFHYLSLDPMNSATRHFRAAEKAVANNAILLHRVRRERVALDHVWFVRYADLWREAQARGATRPDAAPSNIWEGPHDVLAFVEKWTRTAKEFGVERVNEGVDFAGYEKLLRDTHPGYEKFLRDAQRPPAPPPAPLPTAP